jgi:S1-C subfamily serine protease
MLNEFSNQLADAVAAAAPSVVQVLGRRRPGSGVVYADAVVVTTMRSVGKEDGLKVRRHDGTVLDAELAGWDPASNLAVLKVAGLDASPLKAAAASVRVGQVALALARSWSNAITASAGLVSVIGGPLHTGRRRAIEQVIRTTAPMHDGFSGGAFLDTDGGLIGITTALEIRGLHVVIPAGIAWQAAASVLEHGRLKRGYLGIAGQAVRLPPHQAVPAGDGRGVLVVGVADGSPAATAGVLVGDVVMAFGGQAVTAPEDLLDLLAGHAVGAATPLRLLRGGVLVDAPVTVGERPAS